MPLSPPPTSKTNTVTSQCSKCIIVFDGLRPTARLLFCPHSPSPKSVDWRTDFATFWALKLFAFLLWYRIITCEGPWTSVTTFQCRIRKNLNNTNACYYDGYYDEMRACSSICNGALVIGSKGRKCIDYCQGMQVIKISCFVCCTRILWPLGYKRSRSRF